MLLFTGLYLAFIGLWLMSSLVSNVKDEIEAAFMKSKKQPEGLCAKASNCMV